VELDYWRFHYGNDFILPLSGLGFVSMSDEHYQQPEDDGALLFWMHCEELANQPEQTEEPDPDEPIGFDDPPPF